MQQKKTFYLFVTDRCNLKCDYCFNKNVRTNFNDLSLKKWKEIIDKIKQHIGTIVITGGEPTLFSPLNEIIKYIKKVTSNDVYIKMFTNGSTPFYGTNKKILQKIIKEINELIISCDNISDDNHKRFGFSREIFSKNIDWLKSNKLNNKVTLNSVYSRYNLKNVQNIKFYANKNVTAIIGPCTGLMHIANGIYSYKLNRKIISDNELPLLFVYVGLQFYSAYNAWNWWSGSLVHCAVINKKLSGGKILKPLTDCPMNTVKFQENCLPVSEITSEMIINYISE